MDLLRGVVNRFFKREELTEEEEAERARKRKEIQNLTYECERSEEMDWEADLHEHKYRCQKHPQHKDFIPINDLTLEHLPPERKDEEVVQLMKLEGDLIVRLAVSHTSSRRPNSFPNTGKAKKEVPGYEFQVGQPYPYARDKSLSVMRVGSGWIRVTRRSNNNSTHKRYIGPCKCEQECKTSKLPKEEWGMIYVNTAAHVVCDEAEAKRTEVELFYNSEEDKKEGRTITLKGFHMDKVSVEKDLSVISVITHDIDLLERLQAIKGDHYELRSKLVKRYWDDDNISLPYFCISHAHGCSKVISWGQSKEELEGKEPYDYSDQLTYSMPTCPGSSGALVVGMNLWDSYPHSRCAEDGTGRSACKSFPILYYVST